MGPKKHTRFSSSLSRTAGTRSIWVNGYRLHTAMKRWMNAASVLCKDLLGKLQILRNSFWRSAQYFQSSLLLNATSTYQCTVLKGVSKKKLYTIKAWKEKSFTVWWPVTSTKQKSFITQELEQCCKLFHCYCPVGE